MVKTRRNGRQPATLDPRGPSVRRSLSLLAAGAFGVTATALLSAPASAVTAPASKTTVVGTCNPSGPQSVQAAVDAANAGDTVALCAGQTFTENVDITKTLTVTGTGQGTATNAAAAAHAAPAGSATIKSPTTTSTGRKDIVGVHGSSVIVTLRDLNISGPLPTTGGLDFNSGLHVYGSAGVDAARLTVDQIRDTNPDQRGNQSGDAVVVGDRTRNAGSDTPGRLTIADSTVSDYQKTGILVRTDGSSLTSTNVTVSRAADPGRNQGPNGYDLFGNITATITGGSVSGSTDLASTDFTQDTGGGVILGTLAGASITIDGTSFSGNDSGLLLQGVEPNTVTVRNTTTTASRFVGFDSTSDVSGVTFTNNSVTGSGTQQAGSVDVRDDTTGTGTVGTANTYTATTCDTSTPTGICTITPGAALPEAPLAILLPLGALGAAGVVVGRRRRRVAVAA